MGLRRRVNCLEVRRLPFAAYPIYAVFGVDGRVEPIRLNEGSTRTGQDAILTYRKLPRSVPLKAYVRGFDPEVAWKPP
jgi:hypothetical protein